MYKPSFLWYNVLVTNKKSTITFVLSLHNNVYLLTTNSFQRKM